MVEGLVMESEIWLTKLTPPELAHWKIKPPTEKEWWYANVRPEDRGGILRSEIKAVASYNELLHLPEDQRTAVARKMNQEADEARNRIKQHLHKPSDS